MIAHTTVFAVIYNNKNTLIIYCFRNI